MKKKIPMQVKLSPKVARFLRMMSADTGRDISELVEWAVVEQFRQVKVEEADLEPASVTN